MMIAASKECQRGRRIQAITAAKGQGSETLCRLSKQKTLQYKGQTPEERQTDQTCDHAILLLFFSNRII